MSDERVDNRGGRFALSKRHFLGTMGLASTMAASDGLAAATRRTTSALPGPPTTVGSLDLAEIPVVDAHMHPVGRTLISKAYEQQARMFAALCSPDTPGPDGDARRAQILVQTRRLVQEAPRRTGYFNYVARTYGVRPTPDGFDSVVAPHIVSDAAFSAYVTQILDRERIDKVLLQAAEEMPAPPATLIPPSRLAWTSVMSDFTKLSWAQQRGLSSVAAVAEAIETRMAAARTAGCKAFKNVSAYYRPLGLTKPSAVDAERAFSRLMQVAPVKAPAATSHDLIPGPAAPEPRFEHDVELHAALITYEDYLFRRIYVAAGRLDLPIVIHSAVALHPGLRVDFNDPRPLYDVFTDNDIRAAGTRFIVIHSGYPWQDVMGAFISQLPNVYTDVSFYSKYPVVLAGLYRSLLGLGPAYKVMHGSDANSVPEEIGYCASNSRAALALVLGEYRDHFGWTAQDIASTARGILADNAREFYRM